MADNKNMDSLVKALLSSAQGAQVVGNMDKLKSFTSSKEGQELLVLLSGSGGDEIKKAAAAAVGGDKDSAKRMMTSLLSTPDGQKVAKSIVDLMK
ncbi:MAG: hypothetical protein LBL09_04485 [Oscillospiraceae bacterium]|nr:hypothetical protein [Oscillospiraceae bacterium]